MDAHDETAILRGGEMDQWIDSEIPATDRDALSVGIVHFENRSQQRVDSFGVTLNDDSLSTHRFELKAINVATLLDSAVHNTVEWNRFGDAKTVVLSGFNNFATITDDECACRTESVRCDGLHVVVPDRNIRRDRYAESRFLDAFEGDSRVAAAKR